MSAFCDQSWRQWVSRDALTCLLTNVFHSVCRHKIIKRHSVHSSFPLKCACVDLRYKTYFFPTVVKVHCALLGRVRIVASDSKVIVAGRIQGQLRSDGAASNGRCRRLPRDHLQIASDGAAQLAGHSGRLAPSSRVPAAARTHPLPARHIAHGCTCCLCFLCPSLERLSGRESGVQVCRTAPPARQGK